jgi:tRNA threonylcarbamoyladenosine biosynthesis protein TsaB
MIVAFDAASTDLSVAIVDADGQPIASDAWRSAQRQSAEMLPRILALLDRAGRRLTDVDVLAVGTGPGSFTGLRVAMALAKGLGVGLGRPVVGVPSLVAWLEGEANAVAAVTRAGAREGWVLARGADAPVMLDADAIRDGHADTAVVAPGDVVEAFGLEAALPPIHAAAAIGRLAIQLRADAPTDAIAELEPMYLRAPRGLEGAT